MKINPKYIPLLATAAVMLLIYIAGCVSYRNFFSLRVVANLLHDGSFLGVAAVGATFVILSGGIDLSIGSMMAFTGILVAVLVGHGLPPVVAFLVALSVGAMFGAGLGSLIHFFNLPPFLITLAGMFFLRGISFVVNPQSLPIKSAFFSQTLDSISIPLGRGAALPFTSLMLIAVVIVATWLATYTRFGRNVYAIGSSENSAVLMGVPVGATKIGIYTLAGFCSALAGCVATVDMQSGNPADFVGKELDAIASVVIGGTLLTGGVGFVPGTLMGVMILGLIRAHLNFKGDLSSWWTSIAVGALLFIFIVLQKIIGGRSGLRA